MHDYCALFFHFEPLCIVTTHQGHKSSPFNGIRFVATSNMKQNRTEKDGILHLFAGPCMTRRHSFAFARAGSGQSPARNLARGSWVLIGLTCSKNNRSESNSGKKKSGPTQPSALYLLLWVPLCYLMECHCRAKRTTLLCWHGTYLVLVYIVLVPPHLNVWVNSATLE